MDNETDIHTFIAFRVEDPQFTSTHYAVCTREEEGEEGE